MITEFKAYLNSGTLLLLVLGLMGCSPMALTDRTLAEATQDGFQRQILEAGDFKLTSISKFSGIDPTLRIYIEGDGHAWSSFTQISPDPTPHQPLALQLALIDKHPLVAYLARPCQYNLKIDVHCHAKYWTSHRFSPEVVNSLSLAVDQLKAQSHATQIILMGYSGGGGLAALVASKRHDVVQLITFAGDLDHKALSDYHHTTPQTESLNPIDIAWTLSELPQIHLSGEEDNIVPPFIAARFIAHLNTPHIAKHIILKKVNHHQGWIEAQY